MSKAVEAAIKRWSTNEAAKQRGRTRAEILSRVRAASGGTVDESALPDYLRAWLKKVSPEVRESFLADFFGMPRANDAGTRAAGNITPHPERKDRFGRTIDVSGIKGSTSARVLGATDSPTGLVLRTIAPSERRAHAAGGAR